MSHGVIRDWTQKPLPELWHRSSCFTSAVKHYSRCEMPFCRICPFLSSLVEGTHFLVVGELREVCGAARNSKHSSTLITGENAKRACDIAGRLLKGDAASTSACKLKIPLLASHSGGCCFETGSGHWLSFRILSSSLLVAKLDAVYYRYWEHLTVMHRK
jgi:hypothetical protein